MGLAETSARHPSEGHPMSAYGRGAGCSRPIAEGTLNFCCQLSDGLPSGTFSKETDVDHYLMGAPFYLPDIM